MAQEDDNYQANYETDPAENVATPRVVDGPEPTETPEEVVETPEVETPEAKPSVHSADTIAQAARLGITDEEIEGMSANELKFAIRHSERTAREMATIRQQLQPAQEVAKPVDPFADLRKELDDELKWDPNQAKVMKAILDQNQQLGDRLAQIEPSVQSVQTQRTMDQVNAALDAIKPGFSKDFDGSTASSREKGMELFAMLNAIADMEEKTGKKTSHAERTKRAIAAIGLAPTKDDDVLAARREQYDSGALATPVNRKPPVSPEEAVRKIQERDQKRPKGDQYKPQWNE